MIERIIAKLPHEAGCAYNTQWTGGSDEPGCNCSRREMIAWLERLREPTLMDMTKFEQARTAAPVYRDCGVSKFKAGLLAFYEAAEEDA